MAPLKFTLVKKGGGTLYNNCAISSTKDLLATSRKISPVRLSWGVILKSLLAVQLAVHQQLLFIVIGLTLHLMRHIKTIREFEAMKNMIIYDVHTYIVAV